MSIPADAPQVRAIEYSNALSTMSPAQAEAYFGSTVPAQDTQELNDSVVKTGLVPLVEITDAPSVNEIAPRVNWLAQTCFEYGMLCERAASQRSFQRLVSIA